MNHTFGRVVPAVATLWIASIGISVPAEAQPVVYGTSVFAQTNLSISPYQPGVAVDFLGNVYLTSEDAIVQVTPKGNLNGILIAGAGAGFGDGPELDARFNDPSGLAVDATGTLYVADTGNNAIRKITPQGQVSTLAGTTQGFQDGIGAAAQFNSPRDVAVDTAGNVYVVDSGNNALRKVSPDGSTTTLLLGSTLAFANDLAVVPQDFPDYYVNGVTVSRAGILYVGILIIVPFGHADFPSYYVAVLEITGTGAFTQITAPLEIQAAGISLSASGNLAIDGAGRISVVVGITVYRVGIGTIVSYPAFGDHGYPTGIAVDSAGRLYLPNPEAGNYGDIVLATPGGGSIPFGGSVTLSVPGTANPGQTYQWQVDGVAIPGATASTFTVSVTGSYSVVITNGSTSVTSNPAAVTATPRIANISTRALVGTGANALITGFVINGSAGTTEQVLIRGVGPALSQFGLTGLLAQPVLTVLDAQGSVVATNTGWGTNSNTSAIIAAENAAGAFSFPLNSADSALLLTLSPGLYTAEISGLNNTSGIALAEVYEIVAGEAELVNVSSRAYVSTGSNVAIAGFVVQGENDATVLIRGVGPSLANFGVSDALTGTTISVVNSSGTTVATDTGWETTNAVAIQSAAAAVGAFPLLPGDSATLVTLPPGNYSVVVSGTDNTSGVALVEVYQAP